METDIVHNPRMEIFFDAAEVGSRVLTGMLSEVDANRRLRRSAVLHSASSSVDPHVVKPADSDTPTDPNPKKVRAS